MYRKVLNWFGYEERMSGKRLAERVYKSKIEVRRAVGRPQYKYKK